MWYRPATFFEIIRVVAMNGNHPMIDLMSSRKGISRFPHRQRNRPSRGWRS
jgi:hypothetical protein